MKGSFHSVTFMETHTTTSPHTTVDVLQLIFYTSTRLFLITLALTCLTDIQEKLIEISSPHKQNKKQTNNNKKREKNMH